METLPEPYEIAQLIDHALLKPEMTRDELIEGLEVAKKYRVYSVCVRPCDVEFVTQYLQGSDVLVGTVIGFPHGVQKLQVKEVEIREAALDGAAEVDIVLNFSYLRSGLHALVRQELEQLVSVARTTGVQVVKVILETAYLTPEEIHLGSVITQEAGADFVKTSTGFASSGATMEAVEIMRAAVDEKTEVKASGGVSDLYTLLRYREAGVTRFGTSQAPRILEELEARRAGQQVTSSDPVESY